jgi:hypothetical protein
MKHILILLITTLSIFSCKAQTVYPIGTYDIPGNNYYTKDTNNHHDAIVGIWKWESGNTSFEITLQEFEMYSDPISPTVFTDAIFGKYTYIENGVIIAEVNEIRTLPLFFLSLTFRTPTKYAVVIGDVVSTRSMVGEFILTSATTATLELWHSGGVRFGYEDKPPFALPMSLVLTKQ